MPKWPNHEDVEIVSQYVKAKSVSRKKKRRLRKRGVMYVRDEDE
jgi:hypothetical protein